MKGLTRLKQGTSLVLQRLDAKGPLLKTVLGLNDGILGMIMAIHTLGDYAWFHPHLRAMVADLLRRRPDVRQAERQLAAQTARVGVAVADLYPKFAPSGSIGLESFSLNSVTTGSLSLTGGPAITWAIFKGGAIRRNIEVQSALQEQALIQYETIIPAAMEEVENALVAYAEVQRRRESPTEATQAAQKAADPARQKYEAGLTDFPNALDAQRSLLSFQEQQAMSSGNVMGNLVRLYKALGGGWTSLEDEG